jgi:hypothetical protein
MIASHLLNLLAFSALVSAVFATLLRDELKDRLRFAALNFLAFVVSAIVLGWVMGPFPS